MHDCKTDQTDSKFTNMVNGLRKDEPTQCSKKRREQNLIKHLSGSKRVPKVQRMCWWYGVITDMIENIAESTNQQIHSVKIHYFREREAKSTNISEIEALIDLLYLVRVLNSSSVHMDKLGKQMSISSSTFEVWQFRTRKERKNWTN